MACMIVCLVRMVRTKRTKRGPDAKGQHMEAMEEPFYPDGLSTEYIDALLIEAEAVWATPSRATSALLDGSAAARRRRRMSRRAIGGVVRALPTVAQANVTPDSEVA
jgi:hypothetical protein